MKKTIWKSILCAVFVTLTACTREADKDSAYCWYIMRNEFEGRGKWSIPLVKKQELDVDKLSLVACSGTKANDSSANTQNGVHFSVQAQQAAQEQDKNTSCRVEHDDVKWK